MLCSRLSFRATKTAAYVGYVTQAVVNNLAPLLFVTFQRQFGLSLEELSFVIAANFCIQIGVDLLSAFFVDKIGYRKSVVLAHLFSATGLALFSVLPFIMNPFFGILLATFFSATGGGMLEDVVSPIIEAIPSKEKKSQMALLHSFYCWGQMAVVLFSTVYFSTIGTENWRALPFLWALIPFCNLILFLFVPIVQLPADNGTVNDGTINGGTKKEKRTPSFLRQPYFVLCIFLMFFAGSTELAMSQWSSLFAETGLQVSKTVGDLLGPCAFALTMGCGRLLYGIFGERLVLEKWLAYSGVLGTVGYLLAALSPHPLLSLGGCMITGLDCALLWPGTYSLGAAGVKGAGTSMFAYFALSGDLGCALGPAFVAFCSEKADKLSAYIPFLSVTGEGSSLRVGLFFAALFPLLLLLTVLFMRYHKRFSSGK